MHVRMYVVIYVLFMYVVLYVCSIQVGYVYWYVSGPREK